MNRNLLDYLPSIMAVFEEFQEIMRVEQPQIEELWSEINKLLNEKFLSTNTEYGVSRWETILDITPKDTDTLEIRNLKIKAKINEDSPYTEETLKRMLTTLCGQDNYTVTLQNAKYTLTIRIKRNVKDKKTDVIELCERVVPLNIILDIEIMWNTHAMLAEHRHSFLKKYTHLECREKDFEGEQEDIALSNYTYEELERFSYEEMEALVEGE